VLVPTRPPGPPGPKLHTRILRPSDEMSTGLYSGFQRKPAEVAPASAAAAKPVGPAAVPFQHAPSVASWLAPRPCGKLLQRAQQAADTQAEPASPSASYDGPWPLSPSVGTWLNARPLQEPKAPRTTVGLLARRQSSLEKMPNQDLVACFRQEIERKDEEIQQLKQMLGL